MSHGAALVTATSAGPSLVSAETRSQAAISATHALTAYTSFTSIDPDRWRNCYAYVFQPFRGGDGKPVPITNAPWLAAAAKASAWATDICKKYSARDCIAYDYLNDCAGGDIVLRWYENGHPSDPDVTHWLCEAGYASPLYPKFYPISGICPVYGPNPWPEGKVRPHLEAVMVKWNDHEPVYWPVSPIGCEPGKLCTFQFFFPCEPLQAGKEPKIVEWKWKTEPGRVRPSGDAE